MGVKYYIGMESYWGPGKDKSRWGDPNNKTPLVPGLLTHLQGDLTKDVIDIIVVRQRIKEVTQRLSTNDFYGELVPIDEEFNPIYNEDGKRILNSNQKTRTRLLVEKQALEKEGLPSNSLFQAFFFNFINFTNFWNLNVRFKIRWMQSRSRRKYINCICQTIQTRRHQYLG
jgi:hypothetical protein